MTTKAWFVSCLAAAAVGLVGCGGDAEVSADPAALESAFKDAPADAVAEAPAAEAEESTTDTITMPAAGADAVPVKELATRAATALKKDEYTEAMYLLQSLRRARSLSPDQLTAVQDQMANLQSDLARKAEAGDARAKQALALIQQSTRW